MYGNTSMAKSLTSKRQNLKKKKTTTTTKKHENGVEHKKVSFLAVSLSIGES